MIKMDVIFGVKRCFKAEKETLTQLINIWMTLSCFNFVVPIKVWNAFS